MPPAEVAGWRLSRSVGSKTESIVFVSSVLLALLFVTACAAAQHHSPALVTFCRERVGSSQNSPSSSRSLPPLAPAHESASDTMLAQSYPHQPQGGPPLHTFPAGIKLEPGTSFSPNLSRAAQSAAIANLGANPPPAGSPGSLSRTSSSHAIGVGVVNPMGPPRGNPPAWLSQPLSTPMPFSPQGIYQLEGTCAAPKGRGGFSGQHSTLPPALMQHSLSMSRTLSEADISNQSAMSALTGNSVQHMTPLPPSASTSRQTYQTQSTVAGNPQWSPVSPQKLRTSLSYQDLSCNPIKMASSQGFSSPSRGPLPPLQIQTQSQQQPQHAQQQPGNMMVRVGSETHFIPDSQDSARFFGLSRVPSAPFMNLEQPGSGR